MGHTTQRTLPAGRAAVRWFLFLVFFHLLPAPWFMVVVAGLAPASFLFAIGVAGFFVTDFDSLPMAVMFLAAGLISGLIFVLLAYLLAAGIGRLKKPVAITLSLIIVLVVCLGVALNPVYFSGGHGNDYQFSLLDFPDILGQFRVPAAVSMSYFVCLTLLLAGLLVYQHTPQNFPALPLNREQRRRLLRRAMLGGLILFIALICWTHRALFFLKPLADMGIAGAQYQLALALQKNPGSELGSNPDSRYYLERAAEQGHFEAAMALARSSRSADDKLRWLTVAAEGGLSEAQYQLYRFMMKSSVADNKSRSAMDWLQSAVKSGFADAQYEHGIGQDLEMGRKWWDLALSQKHVKTMEYVAPAYQNGRFAYPVDLLKSKALVELLVEAYRDGHYGVEPDADKERYWTGELKHFDRLFDLAGGSYRPFDDRFIAFQRNRLEYVDKARQYQEERSRRYEQATALERQIMDIEDHFRLKYQKAVNGLNRQDGSREGKKQFRAQVERLRQKHIRQRKQEIEEIKRKAAERRQSGK
jgi:accessory gene regulator protein AgrB